MQERLQKLKERVYRANLLLKQNNLITLTWGNVSELDRESGLVAIKPSGIDYDAMTVSDIVVTDLDGKIIEGRLKPSSDLDTHLALYKSFTDISAVVHTHSRWATIFAQAGKEIPMLGTTHADTFYGDIPCTRKMTAEEIAGDYERETGNVIVERFQALDPTIIPGVIVHSHGPFTWGKNAAKSVENAAVLETVAQMAFQSEILQVAVGGGAELMQQELLEKHFYRKHGANAYYGQK